MPDCNLSFTGKMFGHGQVERSALVVLTTTANHDGQRFMEFMDSGDFASDCECREYSIFLHRFAMDVIMAERYSWEGSDYGEQDGDIPLIFSPSLSLSLTGDQCGANLATQALPIPLSV